MLEEFQLLSIVAALGATAYAFWLGYRVYMALGKCPRCQHKMNRSADICYSCGCRVHEHQVRAARTAHRGAISKIRPS